MSESARPDSDPLKMLNTWMKTLGSFWNAASSPGSSGPTDNKKAGTSGPQNTSASRSPWETVFKAWQTAEAAMGQPETFESLTRGTAALPEIFVKLAQSGMNHFLALQQAMLEKGTAIGKKTQATRFENLDRDVFRLLNEVYEEGLKKYLNIPQMGLMRLYQERLQHSVDAFAAFQGAVAEFVHMACLPMESSLSAVQAELSAMAKDGKLPEAPEDYYRMWIKALEGHFMELFKSEDYLQVLQRTVHTTTDYISSRKAVLLDMLQSFPVATEKDMDDLYREIYELKKRLKALEKGRKVSSQK